MVKKAASYTALKFTFYWQEDGRWEGADYEVVSGAPT
jgi:hypothetical protein